MSTNVSPTTPSPRTIPCPPWCAHVHDRVFLDDPEVESRGVWHRSENAPTTARDIDDHPVTVYVDGKRHEHYDDWPDTIRVVEDGDVPVIDLHAAQARRLAIALLQAADLADGAA